MKKTNEAPMKPQNQQKLSVPKGHIKRTSKSRKSSVAAAIKEGQIKDGVMLIDDPQIGRMKVVFRDKPAQEVRDTLKKLGFLWDPLIRAWKRFRNPRIFNWLQGYLKKI